jgi:probable phosphoglycerate mutase
LTEQAAPRMSLNVMHAADDVTHIVAIRHGETDWNNQQRVQGHTDIGLNARGQAQAARLPAALADVALAAVYSSDLSRARDTAAPLALHQGLPLRLEADLRERCFGVFEGRTYAEIEDAWPAGASAWRRRDPDFAPEGGESLSQFQARCARIAVTLAQRHPGATIALVAHGGVLDALYRHASGVGPSAPRTWQLANASINRLLLTNQGLSLVGWADVGHLDDL